MDLLAPPHSVDVGGGSEERAKVQETIVETLAAFGIAVTAGAITCGPAITRYEIYPAKGVRMDKIASLERDIARATRAERITILAPVPGKDTVGVEIANRHKQIVTLRELLDSSDWRDSKAKIPLALGKNVYDKVIVGDLARMPHLLVAGTISSGKSVCIHSIIASILYRFTPDQLGFIMIAPTVLEMQVYNTLPHLLGPVANNPTKALCALRWVINEMEKRYRTFAKTDMRNISAFNARFKPKAGAEVFADKKVAESPAPWDTADVFEGTDSSERIEDEDADLGDLSVWMHPDSNAEVEIPVEPMPYIVIIIQELADLMETAPREVEDAISRITQRSRAVGIHMLIATQIPRADIVSGVIKANIPSRIAFQVSSGLDSRIILDDKGAERLIGRGDMLYLPPHTSRLTRVQGSLVTEDEIRRVVGHWQHMDSKLPRRVSPSEAVSERPTRKSIIGTHIMKPWKLFLDDKRTPTTAGWEIACTYEQAVRLIAERGMPQRIAFDHDLGAEKSGMDFAKWLVESFLDDKLQIPDGFTFSVHSDNPNGAENIRALMAGILREMTTRPK